MLKKSTFKDVLLIIGMLIFSRLIPHLPNFTALGAIAILSPLWFKENKNVLLIPLLALLISDFLIGFHSTMLFTYLGVFLTSSLAWFNKKNNIKAEWSSFFYLGLSSSLLFYLLTNFGAWLMLDMYPKTATGLILSYINGLPFLGFECLGTFFYLGCALCARQIWIKNLIFSNQSFNLIEK